MLVEDDLDYRYLIEQGAPPRGGSSFARAAQAEKARCKPAHGTTGYCIDGSVSRPFADRRRGGFRQIRLQTDARVIILTSREDFETVIRASTHAFASAYLFKSNFPVLIPMIRETAQGVTSQAHLICSALLAPLTDAGGRSAPHSGRRRPPSFLQQDHLQPADGDSAQARPPPAKRS